MSNPRTVKIDGRDYPVPDGFDSTKHNATLQNGSVVVTDKQTNQTVNLASTENTNSDAKPSTTEEEPTSTGEALNVKYALVDEDWENIVNTNTGNFKITIFLAKKFEYNDSNFTLTENIYLKYLDTVKAIYLEDDISSIGLTGYIDVLNISSYLDMFLGRHNNYYLVINFTEYDGEGTSPQTKYEPYIFDISYVQNLTSPGEERKMLRIGLVDCMTSILKNHSIASVIKQHTDIVTAYSYKTVLEYILTYVKRHMQINTNNKYEFKKDLLYGPTMTCLGNIYNGNDTDEDMSDLVKATFGKISRNATIYDALLQILQDACTSIRTPAGFKDKYMDIGNVLIPFFFKEEYPDKWGLYHAVWGGKSTENVREDGGGQNVGTSSTEGQAAAGTSGTSETTTPKPQAADSAQSQPAQTATPTTPAARNTQATTPAPQQPAQAQPAQPQQSGSEQQLGTLQSWRNTLHDLNSEIANNKKKDQGVELWKEDYGGKAKRLMLRQMTMRDIYMPFFLAFGSDDYTGVYEDINPGSDASDTVAINGVYQKEIMSMQFNPIDMNTVRKIWKNVIFLDCSDGGSGGNCTLIFFSWFFDYFQNVFLKSDPTALARNGFRVSNVQPSFHMLSKNENIRHAAKEGASFTNQFDEYNAFTYASETPDVVRECLRVMGRNIASFILLNDSYVFRLNGQILRRPNEIVRFGFRGSQGDTMQELSMHTDINMGEYTYLYIKKVAHIFEGNNYYNDITACKICEVLG